MANPRHRCRRQQAASMTNPGPGVYLQFLRSLGDDFRRSAKRPVNQPIPGPGICSGRSPHRAAHASYACPLSEGLELDSYLPLRK